MFRDLNYIMVVDMASAEVYFIVFKCERDQSLEGTGNCQQNEERKRSFTAVTLTFGQRIS